MFYRSESVVKGAAHKRFGIVGVAGKNFHRSQSAIALYAAAHYIGIVRSFKDEGKTGMTIKGRRGLQDLLQAIQSGSADFDPIGNNPDNNVSEILYSSSDPFRLYPK